MNRQEETLATSADQQDTPTTPETLNDEPMATSEVEDTLLNAQADSDLATLSPAELVQALRQAQQQAQDNWNKALRIQADMENLKKRTQKDIEDAHKFALTGFAKELLPVLDSLYMGLQAASGDSEQVQKFREGCELTIKQFQSAFDKFKIETIDPVGQPFDAQLHQAMVMQPAADCPPNTVLTVFQKGYTLNGRLLRPAMVVVAKTPD